MGLDVKTEHTAFYAPRYCIRKDSLITDKESHRSKKTPLMIPVQEMLLSLLCRYWATSCLWRNAGCKSTRSWSAVLYPNSLGINLLTLVFTKASMTFFCGSTAAGGSRSTTASLFENEVRSWSSG